MAERIKEIIVVEGREDERALKQALEAKTIATHGFGINQATWDLIEKAYLGPGIIILTDPDSAGEMIRKRIISRFPDAKNAYVPRDEARNGAEIGIEHACGESILEALSKARCRKEESADQFTMEDLLRFHLVGSTEAARKRDKLGKALGIGYGNTKTFLRRMNHYGVTREEFYLHGEALFQGDNQQD